jgi:hypothetical protein
MRHEFLLEGVARPLISEMKAKKARKRNAAASNRKSK